MKQYISKDAIVAEIERLANEAKMYLSDFECGRLSICKELMNFLNTLETKEVNLEEECKTYLKNNFTSKEAPDEFLTTLMQLDDMVLFAKHFYELGLNTQKGE